MKRIIKQIAAIAGSVTFIFIGILPISTKEVGVLVAPSALAQTVMPTPTAQPTSTPQPSPTATIEPTPPTTNPSVTPSPKPTATTTPQLTPTLTPIPSPSVPIVPSVTPPLGGEAPTATPTPQEVTPTPTSVPVLAASTENPPPRNPVAVATAEIIEAVERPFVESVARAASTIEPLTRPFTTEYYSPSGLPQETAQGIVAASLTSILIAFLLLRRVIINTIRNAWDDFSVSRSLDETIPQISINSKSILYQESD